MRCWGLSSQALPPQRKRRQGKELADLQLQYRELQQNDDLSRDKMNQELLVQAAKILGQYGTAVDVERVRAMQAMPRDGGVV